MKLAWTKLQVIVNQLQLRERRLLALTFAMLAVGMFMLTLWMPFFQAWQADAVSLKTAKQHLLMSKQRIISIKKRAGEDADLANKNSIKRLQKALSTQQAHIKSITTALINPKDMTAVLSGLLEKGDMRIQAMSNLDAQAVYVKEQKDEINLLFKHGLSLELQGAFASSLEYVQRLESQDWQLFWDELNFTTLSYPMGKLEMKVHTLSTSDSVLGL